MSAPANGTVITARGPVEPRELGRVLMHEHLQSDIYDWDREQPILQENPITAERRDYLLKDAVPHLKQCRANGCFAFVDATPSPWRAWPSFYAEISEAAAFHIILSTGFYREVEFGTYWVKKPEYSIWPFVKQASVDELADFCIGEIIDGIHGTNVHAGAIKLATSAPALTDAEQKAFRAGAQAQKATGVHITTHCTKIGAETSQLKLLESEGVALDRVVVGHTAAHLMNPDCRKVCIDWMRRGANFLPTNLGIKEDGGAKWQPLVDAIHAVFDAGLGGHLLLGLDSGYCSESCRFCPMPFLPPAPFAHMFTHTLPAFRRMGLTAAEEEAMLAANPQRILPVRRP